MEKLVSKDNSFVLKGNKVLLSELINVIKNLISVYFSKLRSNEESCKVFNYVKALDSKETLTYSTVIDLIELLTPRITDHFP